MPISSQDLALRSTIYDYEQKGSSVWIDGRVVLIMENGNLINYDTAENINVRYIETDPGKLVKRYFFPKDSDIVFMGTIRPDYKPMTLSLTLNTEEGELKLKFFSCEER